MRSVARLVFAAQDIGNDRSDAANNQPVCINQVPFLFDLCRLCRLSLLAKRLHEFTFLNKTSRNQMPRLRLALTTYAAVARTWRKCRVKARKSSKTAPFSRGKIIPPPPSVSGWAQLPALGRDLFGVASPRHDLSFSPAKLPPSAMRHETRVMRTNPLDLVRRAMLQLLPKRNHNANP